jgi:hypothetical protein
MVADDLTGVTGGLLGKVLRGRPVPGACRPSASPR